MHGRSFVAVVVARSLVLVLAGFVQAAVAAEAVATAEQPVALTGVTTALPSTVVPSPPSSAAPSPA
ncbi:MAG: hypothetical protein WB662_10410, partial [Methyloceanibacter sp.]